MLNILLFPSGSLVAKEIYDALKFEKNIELFGTDFSEDNLSSYFMKNYIHGCPFVKDEEATLTFLKSLVDFHKINYIFPAFDSVIEFLKRHEDHLGAHILAPMPDVIELCNSKLKTYDFLKDIISTPLIFNKEDKDLRFPLYVKPIVGYGSRNHRLINSYSDLSAFDETKELLLEYLEGDEYTIDCFSNNKGEVLYVGPRIRKKTNNGMSVQSLTVNLPDAHTMAQKIQAHIRMTGAWFFQVKYAEKENKTLKLLEIACRIPGAMCVNRVRGINFPLLSILNHQSIEINPILHNEFAVDCHKIYVNSYKTAIDFDYVYCDLDDTLIIKGKINTQLIALLYGWLNKGKKLFLLTRNSDAHLVLRKYRICVFDFVIILSSLKDEHGQYKEKKSVFIEHPNSIFIDDSYVERADVKANKSIVCLSPSELELFNEYK